jgi:polygalacturonase
MRGLRFLLIFVFFAFAVQNPGVSFGKDINEMGVNVKRFGARGDGKKDDTKAIQAAIDSLPDSDPLGTEVAGGTVLFPPGKYRITSSLSIGPNDNNVTLRGAGNGASIIFMDAPGVAAVEVIGTNSGSGFGMNFRAVGLKFMSKSRNQPGGSYGIVIKYFRFFEIYDCWFQGEDTAAIYIEDALDGTIRNTRIDTAATGNVGYNVGIDMVRSSTASVGAPNQITIANSYIVDTRFAAIRVKMGEKVVIRENLIESNERHGIVFNGSNSLGIYDNYFEANGQANKANVGDITDLGTTLSRNVNVRGNLFSSDHWKSETFFVARFVDVRGLNFVGNELRGGSPQNIIVGDPLVEGSVVTGTNLRDNSAVLDPKLKIFLSPDQIRFTNNRYRHPPMDGVLWTGYPDDFSP